VEDRQGLYSEGLVRRSGEMGRIEEKEKSELEENHRHLENKAQFQEH